MKTLTERAQDYLEEHRHSEAPIAELVRVLEDLLDDAALEITGVGHTWKKHRLKPQEMALKCCVAVQHLKRHDVD